MRGANRRWNRSEEDGTKNNANENSNRRKSTQCALYVCPSGESRRRKERVLEGLDDEMDCLRKEVRFGEFNGYIDKLEVDLRKQLISQRSGINIGSLSGQGTGSGKHYAQQKNYFKI